MRLLQSDLSAHIRQNGAGWIAKYARYKDDDPNAPWFQRVKDVATGKDKIALFKAFTPPSQSNLRQLIKQQLGVEPPEGDDIMLDIITTQHVDNYKDQNIIEGGSKGTYNGVVMDTHNLREVDNIIAHNIGIWAITLPDGVPAWVGASQFHCEDEQNKSLLRRAQRGFIPSRSIGMFVNRYEIDQDTEIQKLLEWEIYEYSYCAVPVNPYCTTGKAMLQKAEAENLQAAIKAGVITENDDAVHKHNGTAAVKHFIPKEIRSVAQKAAPEKDFNSQLFNILSKHLITYSDSTMKDNKEFFQSIKTMPGATEELKAWADAQIKGEGMSEAHMAKVNEAIGHAEDAISCAHKAMTAHKEAEGHMDAFHKAAKKAHKALKAIKGEKGSDKDTDNDGDNDEEKSLSEIISEKSQAKSIELELAETRKSVAELTKLVASLKPAKVETL